MTTCRPILSFSLGAGETTVLRMVTAYSMFDNGGKRIIPTFIDRIQDRYGRTVYKHDQRECRGCKADNWKNQPEPSLVDRREQVIDPMTAYQITSIMEGVVQRGTATVVRSVGKPIAGKTGTTNDEKDVWFIGYSPDIAVGVYIGYDKPRHIGRGATGGASGGADRRRFPEGRARRQAGGAVPRAVRHQADPRRCQDRHARRSRRRGQGDPRSVQARHRAARHLFGDRLDRSGAAAGSPATSVRRPTPTAPRAAAPGFTEGVGPFVAASRSTVAWPDCSSRALGQSLHPAVRKPIMRAETEKLVEDIKRSIGLLRRHL